MLEAEKWAQGKPQVFTTIARVLALSSESFYQIAKDFYDEGDYAKDLTYPSLKTWQSYYKNHREISSFLPEMLSAFYPTKSEQFLQEDEIHNTQKTIHHDNSNELAELINDHGEELYRLSVDEVVSDFSIDNLPKEEQERNVAVFTNPKMNFFMKVYSVCIVFWGEEPGLLLRRARLGNLEALEKILRLDDSMISEPGIARQLYKLKVKGKKSQYVKLIECLGKRPKNKFTRQKIKYVLAGIISAMATEVGYKLTEPDLRALFNAIHADKGLEGEDPDLPEMPHSFYMAVQREVPKIKSHKT